MTRSPSGHRCGESHPKSALSDTDVVRMRAMHKPYVIGYEILAKRFNCGVSTARDICTYRTRVDA